MLFINTRPAERALALTQCLVQEGYDVIDLPVLELQPRPFDALLQQLYQQLSDAQIIVVVSPKAVDVGMQYLTESGIHLDSLKHIHWIAVGKTTALTLKSYGINSQIPDVETSEGMLSLPIFKSFSDLHKIAFWRGEGGRQFMMQQCLQNNVEILNFVLYERQCPTQTFQIIEPTALDIAKHQPPYWVCVSSEASWKNWLELFKNHPNILGNCHYLALGERLYKLVNDDKKKNESNYAVTQVSHLDPHTVLQSMAKETRKL